jgi:molybdopterin/thiamine biosynthesis adenylyltransferase
VLVETVPRDFYDILGEKNDFLNKFDLIVSATANSNLDTRLNETAFMKTRKLPVLYAWTEAFGFAFHAILVIPGKGGCLRCTMDSNFDFRYRVTLLKASEVLKQEAGCGSSFLPYSAIDSDIAAGTAARLALSYFYGDTEFSARWVYLGNLEEARSTQTPISSQYEACGSERLVRFRLSSRYDCPICNKSK